MLQCIRSATFAVIVVVALVVAAPGGSASLSNVKQVGTNLTYTSTAVASDVPGSSGVIRRVGGSTRIDTALATVYVSTPAAASEIYLADSQNYPDALVAGSARGVPVLLVPTSGAVPLALADEVADLNPEVVTVIGGQRAVSDDVARSLAGTARLQRIAGADRYETAIDVSQYEWPQGAATVFIARGDRFADALAGGGLSGGPILLVPSATSIPDAVRSEINRLNPTQVVALGGAAAISDTSLNSLAANGRKPYRLGGSDRYGTAVAIAQYDAANLQAPVVITRADTFPDALAASNIEGAAVLLVPSCGSLPDSVAEELRRRSGASIDILGGESAVCESLADEIEDITGAKAASQDITTDVETVPSSRGSDSVVDTSSSTLAATWVGPAWRPSTIKYYLSPLFTTSAYAQLIPGIQDAMDEWSRVASVRFEQVTAPTSAQLEIGFSVIGPATTLAQVHQIGATSKNTISFNSIVRWTLATRVSNAEPIDIDTIALHELGHILGLGHPQPQVDPSMYYQCDSTYSHIVRQPITVMEDYCGSSRTPTASDVATLKKHYAPGDTQPAPAPEPTSPSPGSLRVSFTENPFVCDGTSHSLGTVSGADAGEVISFGSPQVGELRPGTANTQGALSIVWECDPAEAGESWQVTATGQSSERVVTFTVKGASTTGGGGGGGGTDGRSVELAKGASAQGVSGCTSSSCAYLKVTLRNFSGGSHSVTCNDSYPDDGPYYTYTTTSATSQYCFYGFPHKDVWVTVDGIESNHVTW